MLLLFLFSPLESFFSTKKIKFTFQKFWCIFEMFYRENFCNLHIIVGRQRAAMRQYKSIFRSHLWKCALLYVAMWVRALGIFFFCCSLSRSVFIQPLKFYTFTAFTRRKFNLQFIESIFVSFALHLYRFLHLCESFTMHLLLLLLSFVRCVCMYWCYCPLCWALFQHKCCPNRAEVYSFSLYCQCSHFCFFGDSFASQ